MRKTRSDSRLSTLPEEVRAQLIERMLSGQAYHVIRAWLTAEHQVTVGLTALSCFYAANIPAELAVRRRRAADVADGIAAEAKARPGQWDAAALDALRQRVFDLAIAPGSDHREIKAVYGLVLKHQQQALDESRLNLVIQQYQDKLQSVRDECARAKEQGGITPETLAKIEQAAKLL